MVQPGQQKRRGGAEGGDGGGGRREDRVRAVGHDQQALRAQVAEKQTGEGGGIGARGGCVAIGSVRAAGCGFERGARRQRADGDFLRCDDDDEAFLFAEREFHQRGAGIEHARLDLGGGEAGRLA